MRKTYTDFIQICCEELGWPDAEVRRCLQFHIFAARITEQQVEIYLNYPERTKKELADMFGMTVGQIGRVLRRVRKAWPSLLTYPMIKQHGAPALQHMRRIECSANSDDRLNEDTIRIKF